MWHSLMPAIRAMNMTIAIMYWRTPIRIFFTYWNDMFITMIAMRVMKTAIIHIVHVVVMSDCSVATIRTVSMLRMGVRI